MLEISNEILKNAAKFSRLAYTGAYGDYSYELIEDKKTDTQVYFVMIDDVAYFNYCGTEKKMKDLLTDLKFWRRRIPFAGMRGDTEIRGHSGFVDGYNSVNRAVHQTIIINRPKLIIHDGHSLGGALAQWSVLDCKYHFPRIKHECITFGQPSIGNCALNRSFKKRVGDYYRFENWFDPICHLPFTSRHSVKKIQTKECFHDMRRYERAVLKDYAK